MRAPPAGRIAVCLALLFNLFSFAAAKQCALVAPGHGNLAQPTTSSPSATTTGGVHSGSGSATATASGTASPSPTATAFSYGKTPVRGVNLGGWFVLEPWITPSIFENTGNDAIKDEYTFGQLQDADHALSVLQTHWDTWVTEDDFVQISQAGLNHVRIPLGYWSVPVDSASTKYNTSVAPFVPGAWPYLLRALNWARTHSVHVILDIHGAPGSQNGFDNSGQLTSDPQWASADNVGRTLDILRSLVSQVGGLVDVIELLNEPAGFRSSDFAAALRSYWEDGYQVVRDEVGGDIKVMIGDGFLGVNAWEDFLQYPDAQGVFMDYHAYQIFSGLELSRSLDEHVSFACTLKPNMTAYANSNLWLIFGEWSNAPTDCARWLNGRGVGARWDGTWYPGSPDAPPKLGSCDGWTGDGAGFSDEYKTFLRRYWEVQVELGEAVQGWVFWTWKAENADEWSYQRGLAGGWIPQDPSNRMYPNICDS